MRRVLGGVLFAIPFVFAFAGVVVEFGWEALLLIAAPIAFVACLVVGAHLMAGGDQK